MIDKGIKSFKGKLVIKAILKLESGLHIGASSDFAPIGAVDSPFIRDPYTKQPIIPGSSLKGKTRTLLVRSLCDRYVLNDISEDDDVVKRMYGTSNKGEFHASRLLFTDIKLTEESLRKLQSMDNDTYIGEVKWENTIKRITAEANPRQIERVPAGAEFAFAVIYNVESMDDVMEDMKNLADALFLLQMDYLGGHGSRGYGRVSFHSFEVETVQLRTQNNKELDNIAAEVKALLDEVEGNAL